MKSLRTITGIVVSGASVAVAVAVSFFLPSGFGLARDMKAEAITRSSPPSVSISFSGLDRRATESFLNPEVIYAHFKFGSTVVGDHTLEGRWISPDGICLEVTSAKLNFGDAGGRNAFLWIRFGDPSPKFNGAWTLVTTLNGSFLSRSTFSVSGVHSAPSSYF